MNVAIKQIIHSCTIEEQDSAGLDARNVHISVLFNDLSCKPVTNNIPAGIITQSDRCMVTQHNSPTYGRSAPSKKVQLSFILRMGDV